MADKIIVTDKIYNDTFIAENEGVVFLFKKTQLDARHDYDVVTMSTNLRYELSSEYELFSGGDIYTGKWNVVRLSYEVDYQRRLFISFAYDLALFLKNNKMSNREFSKYIITYADIFRFDTDLDREIIGVFGELFTVWKIYEYSNHNLDISSYLHKNRFDVIDLAIGNVLTDIKTSLDGSSGFHLSSRQIELSANILYVSLYSNSSGVNLFEMVDNINKLGMKIPHEFEEEVARRFKDNYHRFSFDINLSSVHFLPAELFLSLIPASKDDKFAELSVFIEVQRSNFHSIDAFIELIKE